VQGDGQGSRKVAFCTQGVLGGPILMKGEDEAREMRGEMRM